jgi:hypothetical protein
VRERGRERVTAGGLAVGVKLSFDAMVVGGGQSDGCLANPTSTNKDHWCEAFCQTNNPLDQLVVSREDPRWWG